MRPDGGGVCCVNGVMRRYLLEKLRVTSYELREGVLTINDLENADEIFLTNAIKGIRWVKRFRGNTYGNTITSLLAATIGDSN